MLLSRAGTVVVSATATTSLEILPARLGGTALIRDYLARDPRLSTFFSGHFTDPAAYRRKAQAVAARLGPAQRARLAPAFRALSGTAAAKLSRILAGEGFMVTTGQQAGLFGGPLYTVHKALSAICLAEELEELLGAPVLPLFWVAADDHDWAEVDHSWLLDRTGALRRVAVAQEEMPPHAMADRLLGPGVADAIDALAQALPETEYTPALLETVRRAYRPDATVAGAFEDLLAALFRGFDLILMSSAHAAVKDAASALFVREIEQFEEHSASVARQTALLEGAGYHAQVAVTDDASNLFLHDELGRDRLVRANGAWTTRRTKRRIGHDVLLDMIRQTPSRFSPNVFLRPIVESALLPTLAYVGGPAEVSYFAQIGCLFRAHGVEPPVVFPRFRFTLVEGRVRRVAEKFGLELDDFARPLHELKMRLVRDGMPAAVTESAEALRAAIRHGYGRMSGSAVEVDPTLGAWLDKQRNAALHGIDDAERKVAQHLRRRREIELAQLDRAAAGLMPEGVPQERKLNALPFLARYGPDLLRDMKAALHVEWESAAAGWDGVRCPD